MFGLKTDLKTKPFYITVVVFLATSIIGWSNKASAEVRIMLQDNFVSSPVGEKPVKTKIAPWMGKCSGNCPIVSKEQALYGDRSMKTYLHRDKSKSAYRTEIVPAGNINTGVLHGEDWWYAFSVYVPGNHIPDSASHDVVAQWHANKDAGEGNIGGPPIGLRVKNTRWELDVNWTANKITTKQNINNTKYNLGPIAPGTWTDWIFHIKWSYKGDGVLEVWKNGKQVVNRDGPNSYNDNKGPYLKVGLYKTAWRNSSKGANIRSRTFYHDGFVIAKGAGVRLSDITSRLGGASAKGQNQSLPPPDQLRIIK